MDYEQKYAGIGYNTETEFEFAETQGGGMVIIINGKIEKL